MSLRNYDAANTLHQIADCSAFSIPNTIRRNINQHATLYLFPDTSRLMVYATRSRADAWHPAWRGTAADIHLGPERNVPLRINKRGA